MNVDSILLSEFAQTTERGRLTVVNVFNTAGAPNYPATFPLLSLSLVIHGHSEEAGTAHTGEIRLLDADRNDVGEPTTFDFQFRDTEPPPGVPLRHVVARRFIGVTFQNPGVYAFEVYIDGTYHASASFYLEEAQPS